MTTSSLTRVLLIFGATHLGIAGVVVHAAEDGARVAAPARATSRLPDAARGIYAVWFQKEPQLLELPFVRGGQIALQWAELEPRAGEYDFSTLDAQLARYAARGQKTTVQVNGGRRPAYLYRQIAVHPERLSIQITDRQGTLQYWDPRYIEAYTNFLLAYGKHLRASPHRAAVLGVRLNFNALGTEHMGIKPAQNVLEKWRAPEGGRRHEVAWSPALDVAYRRTIVETFKTAFAPDVRIFVRNNILGDAEMAAYLTPEFQSGRLALFHTSSETEPRRSDASDAQYRTFIRFCRSGQTTAYAESWADAKGFHGAEKDDHTQSPPQWNYWRLLVDLHCGVSFIAVYGNDLARAGEPEFGAAFDFASRYAGTHASPAQAPGAWVALRQGNTLKGDYTFLMQRVDEGAAGIALENIGPREQRFGAWARAIEGDQTLRFQLDSQFAASLRGRACRLRVVYLDRGRAAFTVRWAGAARTVTLGDSGRWQEEIIEIPVAALGETNDANHIALSAQGDRVVFHMIEVQRNSPTEARP
jgi:hypothetical protein